MVPAPPSLRRYLTFAKLPDPALEIARRVLDDDEAFRRRVADVADEDTVGRAGWLFLHRPEGWRDELDGLLQEAAAAEIAAKDERHERTTQRRLAGTEAALARAEAAAQASAADAEAARLDLHDERLAARALADEVDRLRVEVERLAAERADVIRRLKAAEATSAERSAGLRAARHEARMLQAELAQAGPGSGPSASGSAPSPSPAIRPGEAIIDRRAAVGALDAAVGAADRLGAALSDLRRTLGLGPGSPPVPSAPSSPSSAASSSSAGGPAVARPRRRPVPLPPAVFDDAPEAAEHLVRTPGVLVLVDGYNISHAQWYGRPPSEQRDRLLDACDELHARVGVELEVVFDGTDDEPGAAGMATRSSARAPVRHRFTPAGVEADDVLLDRVDEEPPGRPVVVVSSDRRVRDGARRRGANVLGARQFLAVLRR